MKFRTEVPVKRKNVFAGLFSVHSTIGLHVMNRYVFFLVWATAPPAAKMPWGL